MKYLKQFCIIILISFLGEILGMVVPIPVPGSIYGMLILFLCLLTGLIKLSGVKQVASVFLEVMPFLFVPAGVGLLSSWGNLKPILVPVLIVTVVSLIAVIAVSGWVSQIVIRKDAKSKCKKIEDKEKMEA